MKTFAMLWGCLLLALIDGAVAAPPEIAVRGGPSCGEWVAHRDKSDTLALGNAYWLVGYLSGIAVGSGTDLLPGTDISSINGWMDKYCKTNPLKDAASGGNALATELLKNKRTAK